MSHDFDFFFGRWQQANRKRVKPLVQGDTEWVEFESVSEAGPILGGLGNIDTFKAPRFPGRPGFEGFSLRLYEPTTGLADLVGVHDRQRPTRRTGCRPVPRWHRHLRMRRRHRGSTCEGPFHLERHRPRRGHVGAVVFLRRGCDVGHQLDHPAQSRCKARGGIASGRLTQALTPCGAAISLR
jgi:hypothetical protein